MNVQGAGTPPLWPPAPSLCRARPGDLHCGASQTTRSPAPFSGLPRCVGQKLGGGSPCRRRRSVDGGWECAPTACGLARSRPPRRRRARVGTRSAAAERTPPINACAPRTAAGRDRSQRARPQRPARLPFALPSFSRPPPPRLRRHPAEPHRRLRLPPSSSPPPSLLRTPRWRRRAIAAHPSVPPWAAPSATVATLPRLPEPSW